MISVIHTAGVASTKNSAGSTSSGDSMRLAPNTKISARMVPPTGYTVSDITRCRSGFFIGVLFSFDSCIDSHSL